MRSLLLVAMLGAAMAAGPMDEVKAVYLLPMSSGMDQYIAQRLSMEAVYPVVTDPRFADAVLTDQIGRGFEQRLAELYPPEPEIKPAPAEGNDKKSAREREDEERKAAAEESRRQSAVRPVSSFSRGQGNYFLVDLKSRRVLWSAHERPRNSRPEEMQKASERLIARLKQDLGRK